MILDFHDGMSDDTAYTLKRSLEYVEMAIKNGDAAYQDKPGEVKILIRKPKDGSKTK